MKLLHKLVLLSCFLLPIFLSTTSNAQIQTEPKYYRYFIVNTQNLSDGQLNKFIKKISENPFYEKPIPCLSENKILIAVKANYPTRVDDILSEITTTFKSTTDPSTLKSVEKTVPETSKNFCR